MYAGTRPESDRLRSTTGIRFCARRQEQEDWGVHILFDEVDAFSQDQTARATFLRK